MKTSIPQPDRCIACTTCTVACPVAQATPNFLGPRMTGPAFERFRMVGLGEDESLHYCSNCKNCDISCPCNVPVSTFIMRARAQVSGKQPPFLRDWILAHGEVLSRRLGLIPAALRNFGMQLPPVRFLLHKLGISRGAPLPDFAPRTFRQAFRTYAQPRDLPKKVVFFPGCFVDIYDPASGMDMVAVLNEAGYQVIAPKDFVCCGLPLVANGFWEDARKNATQNMTELARWKDQGLPVLTGCPSCALMFKEDYAEYFPDLLPHGLSPALADICEFLLEAMDKGQLVLPKHKPGPEQTNGSHPSSGADMHNRPQQSNGSEQKTRPEHEASHAPPQRQTVLYHAPCHLRVQGLGLPGLDLLRSIPGLKAENADKGCCGISGSYGFKADKYDIAMRVGKPLFEAMRHSEAEICASECGTCRIQMRHGGGKPVLHPVSMLRRSLGI